MANRERWRHNWGKSVTRAPWTIKRACRSCRGSIVSFLFCGFAPSSKTILLSSSPCAIQVTRTFFQKISRLDSYNSRRIGTLVLTKISFQKEKPRKSFRCERWKIESNRRLNTVKLDERERERGGEYCNNIIRCWLLFAQRYRKSWLKSGQPRRPQKWNRVESARQSLYA